LRAALAGTFHDLKHGEFGPPQRNGEPLSRAGDPMDIIISELRTTGGGKHPKVYQRDVRRIGREAGLSEDVIEAGIKRNRDRGIEILDE